nr:DUF501 domain-containing protein [Actinomycetales bacterium]
MSWDAPTKADISTLEEQLGRLPRGVIGVGARCVCGRPLVVVTAPRLDDGTPFPTTFYLTSPAAVRGASTLEARGDMEEMNAGLSEDEDLRAAYEAAHRNYLEARAELGDVPEISGVTAGGMPTRVKCLHALLGHTLAVGEGVNPFGDETLARLAAEDRFSLDRCWC